MNSWVVEVFTGDGLVDTATLEIIVKATTVNNPPIFYSNPIGGSLATVGITYDGGIAAYDLDGDTLTYTKLSGPDWLTVSSNGRLSGTPEYYDRWGGSWLVQVSDGKGGVDVATLNVPVVVPIYGDPNHHFRPTDFVGCELWLDATDVDGDDRIEGASESGLVAGSVVTWADKSLNHHDATQTLASKRAAFAENALNGHPVLRFDGADDSYEFPEITDAQTIFWVVKENTGATQPRFLLGHDTAYDFHRGEDWGGELPGAIWNSSYTSSNILNGITRLDGTGVIGPQTVLPQGDYHVISLRTTGNVKANRLTEDRGFGRTWDGEIAEVIIYSQKLSDQQIQEVEDYLNEKWNLN